MKRFTLILSLLFLSISLFSQRLEEKPVSKLDDNTLFAVQDSGQLYNWRKISFEALQGEFNTLRTPYGNVAGVDSTAILQGVSFYKDSTVFNNTLIAKKIKIGLGLMGNGWTKLPNGDEQPTSILDNLGIYDEPRNQYFGVEFDKGNGGLSLMSRPKRMNNGRSWSGVSHTLQVRKYEMDTLQNSPDGFSRSLFSFKAYLHDTTDTGNLYWPPLTSADMKANYPNLRLFSIKSGYGSQTHRLDVTPTETRISDILAVTDATNQNRYFEVTSDETTVNNTLVANDGLKLSELSYTPTSSTDLQAEAAAAEVGTMWQLNISGSWYLVTKISATTLARTAFSEW